MVEAALLNRSAGRNGARAASTPAQARPIRLLAFVSKPHGIAPGQRFRLEQWSAHLAARHGITVDFVPFESRQLTNVLYSHGHKPQKAFWVLFDFARRAGHVLSARRYDAVVVFREVALLGPAIYERALSWAGLPIIYDFDDAIWLPTQISSVNGIFSRLHFFGKTSTACRLATAVTVGNSYLAEYARERNRNVFVVPTSIDLDRYPVQPALDRAEPFVVGWSGSFATLAHFEHARGALERIAKQRKLVVRVVCNKAPEKPIAGAENVFTQWREQGEAEELGRVHVGIMPLPDDPYTRGKCGLKALQYMATGRPVVISPVGMNSELIESGVNGFLAASEDEWVDALERLATGHELRATMGAAARRTVEERYSAGVVSDLFATAVRRALST